MTKEIRPINPSLSFTSMAINEQEKIAKSVEYEILKVEKLRALIFAIIIGCLAIFFVVASSIYIAEPSSLNKSPIPRKIIALVLIGFSGFELLIWYFIKHCLNTGKSIPEIWRYVIAFVEISLPTMLIFIASYALHFYALFLPPVFIILLLTGFE